MNRMVRWGLVLSLMPLAACSHRQMAQQTANEMTAQPAAAAPAPAPLSQADATFVAQAAEGGMAEVQAGQLAAQRARRAPVRKFAEQMVNQHTQANQQLMQLAQAHGITPPAEPGQAYQRQMQRLERLHGYAFDRAYIRSQIADHRAVIALFQREAQDGQDPDLKNFAAQTVPLLEQHLQEAERLAGMRHQGRHAAEHHTTAQ